MSLILALDQSTSATKAVLFDADGRVVDKASRDHRQIYPQPGWVEHDAEEIWQNVLAAIRDLAGRQADKLASAACLSITNQRETILVFERGSGHPLHNAIVWQDRRGDPICRQLTEAGHGDLVRNKTGLKIDTYFSASKLKWLIAEKPEIRRKLQSGEALIGTIDAYLVYRLTNGRAFATDHTNASRTLIFDISTLRWDEELCRLFDVPMAALPEIRESASRFGETDAGGALPKALPIVGVMGDSQASLFAQRCYQPGMAKATFGTGTSVLLNIGDELRGAHAAGVPFSAARRKTRSTNFPNNEANGCDGVSGGPPETTRGPRVLPESGAVTALAWVWQGRPTYAFEGIINYSAATIEWLKNQMGLIQSAAEVEALATSVADNGGVYLVPAFAGLSAPYWSPDARAAIVGMTAFTKKEHIVRAALESIAYQIRDVLDMMQAEQAHTLRSVNADGGPTRNGFLMQFTADMTGVEWSVSEVAESSAWGAAMSGMLGAGLHKSLADLAALPRETRTYRPQMNAAAARELYTGWQAAVKRVL